MGESFSNRLRHAWNAFTNRKAEDELRSWQEIGASSSYRLDRSPMRVSNERSTIVSVFNRIAMDVAAAGLHHVRVNETGRFEETIASKLQNVLTIEANIDQTARAFTQDLVESMFDEGCVAVVPTDTTLNPNQTGGYDILSLRTGKILEWYPAHVRVRLYNDRTGLREDLLLAKKLVAIITNPLYAVMNEPNGTLKRLIRKLNLLDAIDEQSGAGKLDVIIKLPYTIKSDMQQARADKRKAALEEQLMGSRYGIAYIDSTEQVVQLNRPADNNLMTQIEYLTQMLYGQLGISQEVFTGKADEAAMLNYHTRTIQPILSAIADEYKRKFLTPTARTQRQSIMYFMNSFSLVPAKELADIADKFTRNEILSSNEVRALIGYKPSADPAADELRNKNLNQAENTAPATTNQNGSDETVSSTSKGG